MTPTSPSPPARLLLALVRLYRTTGSFRAPRCRFHPTCSQYALDAILLHGAGRGGWLGIRRILRCHPFHPGGIDHVPGRNGVGANPAASAAGISEVLPDNPPDSSPRHSHDEASHDAVVA